MAQQKQYGVWRCIGIKGSVAGIGSEQRRQNSDGTLYKKKKHSENFNKEKIKNNIVVRSAGGVGGHGLEEALQKRIKEAGIKTVRENQNRALSIIATGSRETMIALRDNDRAGLERWYNAVFNHLKNTYGDKNVLEFLVHLDEATPHIHAIVVPITNYPRKRKPNEDNVKKRYKKDTVARLSCDRYLSSAFLSRMQDEYGEIVQEFGMDRGIKGSTARHMSQNEWYRKLKTELIPDAQSELEQVNNDLRKSKAQLLTLTTYAQAAKINKESEEEDYIVAKEETKTAWQTLFQLKHKVKGLSSMVDNLEKDKEDLEEQIKSIKKELEKNKNDNNELSFTLIRKKEEIDEKEKALKEVEEKLSKKTESLKQATEDLARAETITADAQLAARMAAQQDPQSAESIRQFAQATLLSTVMASFSKTYHKLDESTKQQFAGSTIEQTLKAGTSVVGIASMLFSGLVGAALEATQGAMGTGGGGGGGSELPWRGREDDENDSQFMRRCIGHAIKLCSTGGARISGSRKPGGGRGGR